MADRCISFVDLPDGSTLIEVGNNSLELKLSEQASLLYRLQKRCGMDTTANTGDSRICHSHDDLARAVREVAFDAAREWSHHQAGLSSSSDPEEFGAKVAKVFVAALQGLNEGCAPCLESREGRV